MMLCCSQCFASEILRREISARGGLGDCEICGAVQQPCVRAEALRDRFGRFMYAYRPPIIVELLGTNGPSETHNLAAVLERDGVLIFSAAVPLDRRNSLLDAILGHAAGAASSSWTSGLEPLPMSFFHGWAQFREHVLSQRRYVVRRTPGNDFDLAAALRTSNRHFVEEVGPAQWFYRARLHEAANATRRLAAGDVAAPPPDLCKAGRANAAGIRVLYTADSADTAIAEIRPHIDAVVSVGRFRPRQTLRIFDLSRVPSMAPLDPFGDDFAEEMRTAAFFSQLNEEFSRPIPPFTPERDYAPTQIVAEHIAEQGYAGIKYRSAMRPDGANYVFFDCDLLEFVNLSSFKVKEVRVTNEPYDPEWMQNLLLGTAEQGDYFSGNGPGGQQ